MLSLKVPRGTRSILFGTHCWFIHPIFVMFAWWKLYGFPKDWKLWVCFFIHDLGYWGLPEMDSELGETHVEFGANLATKLFGSKYGNLCKFHSRYYAKKHGVNPSQLCMADKLSIALEPWWLYLPRTWASGELREYMTNAKKRADSNEKLSDDERKKLLSQNPREWFDGLKEYMIRWVEHHKVVGTEDTWTASALKKEALDE